MCRAIHRVLTEISDVLGDRKLVTADDLEQLHYTEQVHVHKPLMFGGRWSITPSIFHTRKK